MAINDINGGIVWLNPSVKQQWGKSKINLRGTSPGLPRGVREVPGGEQEPVSAAVGLMETSVEVPPSPSDSPAL